MNDPCAAASWLLANLLLLMCAWLWSRRLFPADGARQMAIHVLTMGWSWVVIHATALGAMGLLSPARLLASVAASCLVALIVLGGTGRRHRDGIFQARLRVGRRWWVIAWGIWGSLAGAHILLDGLLSFPKDWDSLAYHIPLVDHWLREGTLYVPDCAFWYCPSNNELIGLWCVAPFSGDFLIALNNVPAAILLATAAVELATSLRLSPPLAHLSAMVTVTTQPMWRQLVSAENDIAVAALFLTALVYGLRFARRRDNSNMVLLSLALGLLAGVKYYALGYAGVAGVSVVVLLTTQSHSRDAVRLTIAVVVSVTALAGYWYLRNAYLTGTPLYPKGFTESTDVWSVIRPGSHTSTLLRSGRPEVWPLLFKAVRNIAGPGQWLALALAPATAIGLGMSAFVLRARPVSLRRSRWWFLMVTALAGLVLLVTPNVVETVPGTMNMLTSQYHSVRFSLCFLTLCVVGLGTVLNDTGKAWAAVQDLQSSNSFPAQRARISHHPTVTRHVSEDASEVALAYASGGCRTASRTFFLIREKCGRGVSGSHGIKIQPRVERRWLLALSLPVGAVLVYQLTCHVWGHLSVDFLWTAANLFLLGLLLLAGGTLPCRSRRAATAALVLSLFPAAAWASDLLAARWHRDHSARYRDFLRCDAFALLARLEPNKERIGVCEYRYYPFFGSRRQFDVCRPLWLRDDSAWLRYLGKERVTLLVSCNQDSNPQRRYAYVRSWITAHPESFHVIHQDARYTLARVLGTRQTAPVSPQFSPRVSLP